MPYTMYYIGGGPMDLTKRVEGGEHPDREVYIAYMPAIRIGEFGAVHCEPTHHAYRVIKTPARRNESGDTYVAVYDRDISREELSQRRADIAAGRPEA